MYVLGVDLHLFVKPFGAGNLFFTVQVIQSAILRSDVQAVVRSIDNLADSFSAQMVETASVRIYLELVGAEYIIVDSSEIGAEDAERVIIAGDLTLDKVRHERKVELAFEKHRYWDLKRWRLAHLDVSKGGLTNFRGTALCPYYNVKSGKYTFETGVPEKRKRLFLEKNYYTVFRAEDLSTNPLMTQNPGYGN